MDSRSSASFFFAPTFRKMCAGALAFSMALAGSQAYSDQLDDRTRDFFRVLNISTSSSIGQNGSDDAKKKALSASSITQSGLGSLSGAARVQSSAQVFSGATTTANGNGFGCEAGKVWDMVYGMAQCVAPCDDGSLPIDGVCPVPPAAPVAPIVAAVSTVDSGVPVDSASGPIVASGADLGASSGSDSGVADATSGSGAEASGSGCVNDPSGRYNQTLCVGSSFSDASPKYSWVDRVYRCCNHEAGICPTTTNWVLVSSTDGNNCDPQTTQSTEPQCAAPKTMIDGVCKEPESAGNEVPYCSAEEAAAINADASRTDGVVKSCSGSNSSSFYTETQAIAGPKWRFQAGATVLWLCPTQIVTLQSSAGDICGTYNPDISGSEDTSNQGCLSPKKMVDGVCRLLSDYEAGLNSNDSCVGATCGLSQSSVAASNAGSSTTSSSNTESESRCEAPNEMINGSCQAPQNTDEGSKCLAPNEVIDGICQAPKKDEAGGAECLSPNVIVDGVCQPPKNEESSVLECLPPNMMVGGVCQAPDMSSAEGDVCTVNPNATECLVYYDER